MMKNLTDRFLDNIIRIRRMEYSAEVETLVRTYLADTVGVSLAGAADIYDKEMSILSMQKSRGESRPIGHEKTCSLSDALFINGLSAHFLELDDGVRYGVIHPSAPLFSALIPTFYDELKRRDYYVKNFFVHCLAFSFRAGGIHLKSTTKRRTKAVLWVR